MGSVTNDAQLKIASNLSDLVNVATARSNLGLGNSATLNVGTAAGTVAAGDHLHTSVYEPAHTNIQAQIASTSNPHNVTAGQVGNSTAQWNANKLQGITVDDAARANGKILKYNSSSGNLEYVFDDNSAGTVTNIATGSGLSGGPITATGTIDLKLNASGGLSKTLGTGSDELGIGANGVTNAMLAGSIADSKLQTISTAGKVADSALSANVSLLGQSIDLGNSEATGTLAAGRFPALTGEVTTSAGSLATTIENNVVTLAKFQQVVTGSVLGRSTGGTGNIEVLTALPAISGVNLTNLNASNLGSGTVPLTRISGLTNTEISPSAGIAYSKLSISGSIVDADVNNSAAIAWSKISKSGSSLADLATRSASDLASGTLPDARFPATLPAANGANLTNLNASSLVSGTVPLGRLSGITNAEIASGAAIAYGKLALSAAIVNADIASSAAIADTKLATISTAGKVADSALSSNVALFDRANIFSVEQTIDLGALGDTAVDGLVLRNETPATALDPRQHAPMIVFELNGWNEDDLVSTKWEMNERFHTQANSKKPQFSWEWAQDDGSYELGQYLTDAGDFGAVGYIKAGVQFQFLTGSGFFAPFGLGFDNANAAINNFNTSGPLRFSTGNTTTRAFVFNAANTLTSGNLLEGIVPNTGFTGSLLQLGKSSNGTSITTVLYDINADGYLTDSGFAFRSGAGDPTGSDIADGFCSTWKNASSGAVRLWCNDGGTLKSVVLN